MYLYEAKYIIAIIALSIMLFIFAFILVRKQEYTDETNSYGVNTNDGHDRIYHKLSIIMISVSAVIFLVATISAISEEMSQAKNLYNYDKSNYEYAYEKYKRYSDLWWEEYQTNGLLASDNQYTYLKSYYAVEMSNYQKCTYGMKSYFYWEDVFAERLFTNIIIIIFAVIYPLYMFPTRIARKKEHEQTTAICWINTIFGFTIIVWIAMLIWANSENTTRLSQNPLSISDRVSELQDLKDKGLITAEQFESKKNELISKL